jgi:hypothetical protein
MPRMTRLPVRLLMFALAATMAAGCKGDNLEDIFGPTPTLPDPTTVHFSGSVTPNGAFTHDFFTNAFGTVEATLVALDPEDASVGFALGTWNGVACNVVIANDRATLGLILTGNVSAAGGLCVRLYDAGTLTGPVAFEVRLVHP